MTVADRSSDELWVCHLGTVPYQDAMAMQERIRAGRQAGELPDTLLLLEHPPVYTLGRRSAAGDLPFDEEHYRAKGVEVLATDRGGKLTYHGPGQLVGYPIMAIADVHRHLRTMEAAIISALAEEGLEARSRHEEGIDFTGVWVEDRKIASIGVHVSRAVTTHGFAVNVENDLEPFTSVVACGLPDVTMTSVRHELGPARATGMTCVRRRLAFRFCEAHGRRQRIVSPGRLGIDTANAAGLAAERAPFESNSSQRAEAVPA
ncbi:MAG TPA: lipoyl(octanoyl) transferase LipB [Solirubrobacteraceae bacterium]|jgi:lipoyl(octanoyl) transferase|nr:lipoyl(octanoyl) transferase LipB [Solirubrobacteraceae bacterium]